MPAHHCAAVAAAHASSHVAGGRSQTNGSGPKLPAGSQSVLEADKNARSKHGPSLTSLRAASFKPLSLETFHGLKGTQVNSQSKVEQIKKELSEVERQITSRRQVASQLFVDSTAFKTVIVSLVIVNAVQMGMEADLPEWKPLWDPLEHIFTASFLIEMMLKLFALGPRGYVEDRWNLLDGFLVGLSILDTWILGVLDASVVDLQMMSILRILRILRLARVLRLIRGCEKLVLVIYGVIDALQTAFWVGIVLFLAIYVASIFCVSVFSGDRSDTYPGYATTPEDIDEMDIVQDFNPHASFGSVSRAMLTLFNIALLAEWPEIVTPVMLKEPWIIIFFLVFVIGINFAVMNVIIGIIVDTVMTNARKTQELEMEQRVAKQLDVLGAVQKSIESLDGDQDGVVSFGEMEQAINGHGGSDVLELLRSSEMDLPHGFSAAEMLCMLDHDGDATITIDEFAGNFYRLLSSNPFQQICMLQTAINSVKRIVLEHRHDTHRQLDRIELTLDDIMSRGAAEASPGGSPLVAQMTPGEGGGVASPVGESPREPAAVDMPPFLAVLQAKDTETLQPRPVPRPELGGLGALQEGNQAHFDRRLRESLETAQDVVRQAKSPDLCINGFKEATPNGCSKGYKDIAEPSYIEAMEPPDREPPDRETVADPASLPVIPYTAWGGQTQNFRLPARYQQQAPPVWPRPVAGGGRGRPTSQSRLML